MWELRAENILVPERTGRHIYINVCVSLFRSFHSGGISLETEEMVGVPWGAVSPTSGEKVKC